MQIQPTLRHPQALPSNPAKLSPRHCIFPISRQTELKRTNALLRQSDLKYEGHHALITDDHSHAFQVRRSRSSTPKLQVKEAVQALKTPVRVLFSEQSWKKQLHRKAELL